MWEGRGRQCRGPGRRVRQELDWTGSCASAQKAGWPCPRGGLEAQGYCCAHSSSLAARRWLLTPEELEPDTLDHILRNLLQLGAQGGQGEVVTGQLLQAWNRGG